jgi:hypothetical protein
VLAATALVLGYEWLSAAVALDDARQEQQHQRERVQLLQSLITHTLSNPTRLEFIRSVRQHFSNGHVIKEHKDRIEVDDVVIGFRGDAIVSVGFLDDEGLPHR